LSYVGKADKAYYINMRPSCQWLIFYFLRKKIRASADQGG